MPYEQALDLQTRGLLPISRQELDVSYGMTAAPAAPTSLPMAAPLPASPQRSKEGIGWMGYTFRSQLELRYARHLEIRRASGEILSWHYEMMTLVPEKDCTFTPDWLIVALDGSLEFHETKGGFPREDARIKLRLVPIIFHRYRFVRVTHSAATGWTLTPVIPGQPLPAVPRKKKKAKS